MRPDSHRRKWDRDEYAKLAQERLREGEEEEAEASTSKGGKRKITTSDDPLVITLAAQP
jgi:hypothetical protein